MDNCTLSTTLDDNDIYAIQIDSVYITEDYDTPDIDVSYKEQTDSETDILFE